MSNKKILEALNLGAAVAENDEHLANYFVQTAALRDFVSDRYDVVRGVKGSGKSAILRMTSAHQAKYPDLGNVKFVVATEHAGEPAFKRAFERFGNQAWNEDELVRAWKVYLLNLALDALEALPLSDEARRAVAAAEEAGVRFRNPNLFKKLWWSLLRMINPRQISIGETISAEFPDQPPEFWLQRPAVDFPGLHEAISAAFDKAGIRCWILVDRLDAAFQADPALEQAALRAILVAYKDFMGKKDLRIKLFFRTDLFDVVTTGGGFRELTHVQDRTSPPITWDPDRLLQMIMERFVFNASVRDKYGISVDDLRESDDRLAAFLSICPQQVDAGEKRPDSWNWVYNRLRDGNGVSTPRDLQVLMQNAARKQLDRLHLGHDPDEAPHLIGGTALKEGLTQLSTDKIRTSLIAETPDMERPLRAFTKGKAEHNAATLKALLGQEWESIVKGLERIGFLERLGDVWKVPMLYRDGLEITQGAAYEK